MLVGMVLGPFRLLAVATVAAVLLGMAACGGEEPGSPPEPPASPDGPTPTTASPSSSTPASTGLEPQIEAARQQVAERFGHDPAALELEVVEEVTWPNAALGCPKADRQYEPQPTPGYRIVLLIGDLRYVFHGAAGDAIPFQCEFLD